MKPIAVFDHAIGRAIYLVDIHDLLCNTRERKIREDWAEKFRTLMHWNKADALVRVDGTDKNCVMVFRNHPSLEMEHFAQQRLSELLRAGLASGISAFDRYMHDLVVYHVLKLLARPAEQVPKDLAEFAIPLIDAEAAVAHALSGGNATSQHPRPRTTLKERFRTALHGQTFQSARNVELAFSMLGIGSCWTEMANIVGGTPKSAKAQLGRIVRRRNQIVHEGDMVRSPKPRSVKLHDIDAADLRADLNWLKTLGGAIDQIVNANL